MCTTLLYSGVEYLSIYLFKNNPTELHKVDFMTGYRRLILQISYLKRWSQEDYKRTGIPITKTMETSLALS